jgi:hypothetical protein
MEEEDDLWLVLLVKKVLARGQGLGESWGIGFFLRLDCVATKGTRALMCLWVCFFDRMCLALVECSAAPDSNQVLGWTNQHPDAGLD